MEIGKSCRLPSLSTKRYFSRILPCTQNPPFTKRIQKIKLYGARPPFLPAYNFRANQNESIIDFQTTYNEETNKKCYKKCILSTDFLARILRSTTKQTRAHTHTYTQNKQHKQQQKNMDTKWRCQNSERGRHALFVRMCHHLQIIAAASRLKKVAVHSIGVGDAGFAFASRWLYLYCFLQTHTHTHPTVCVSVASTLLPSRVQPYPARPTLGLEGGLWHAKK